VDNLPDFGHTHVASVLLFYEHLQWESDFLKHKYMNFKVDFEVQLTYNKMTPIKSVTMQCIRTEAHSHIYNHIYSSSKYTEHLCCPWAPLVIKPPSPLVPENTLIGKYQTFLQRDGTASTSCQQCPNIGNIRIFITIKSN
jgi:hypothetical protein